MPVSGNVSSIIKCHVKSITSPGTKELEFRGSRLTRLDEFPLEFERWDFKICNRFYATHKICEDGFQTDYDD